MFTLLLSRVTSPKRVLSRQKIGRNTTSIGRDPACDIQLAEPDVSRLHATIVCEGSRVSIADKSCNGTFVNGLKIKKQRLSTGDIIKISGWLLTLAREEICTDDKTIPETGEAKQITGYEESKKELASSFVSLTIRTVGGTVEKKRITQGVFGSDKNCNVVINDDYVSTRHFEIKYEGRDFVICDLDSSNGTYLNGKKIKHAKLGRCGTIVAGGTSLNYNTGKEIETIGPSAETSLGPIVGSSKQMRELFTLLVKISASKVPACIVGESGTGKELIARYLHENGIRRKKPFIAVNCGAIPASLIESEFFGHEKGAFTGASSQYRGYFEQADGGTLFLDEIGEMPKELQTRLLRVLETKTIKRVGGSSEIGIDTRIICATNRDLPAMVKKGEFRGDLFFRLYVLPIKIVPLRERREDIKMLAEYFLQMMKPEDAHKDFTDEALAKLQAHTWPGNVRELKNVVQRALIASHNRNVDAEHIVISYDHEEARQPFDMQGRKKAAVVEAIKQSGGNASAAAKSLGIARSTLYTMMKRFNCGNELFGGQNEV